MLSLVMCVFVCVYVYVIYCVRVCVCVCVVYCVYVCVTMLQVYFCMSVFLCVSIHVFTSFTSHLHVLASSSM